MSPEQRAFVEKLLEDWDRESGWEYDPRDHEAKVAARRAEFERLFGRPRRARMIDAIESVLKESGRDMSPPEVRRALIEKQFKFTSKNPANSVYKSMSESDRFERGNPLRKFRIKTKPQ